MSGNLFTADSNAVDVARLEAAGWTRCDYCGQPDWWRSPDGRRRVQHTADAIRWLNEDEQAQKQPGEA
jgi:hypothetical protein